MRKGCLTCCTLSSPYWKFAFQGQNLLTSQAACRIKIKIEIVVSKSYLAWNNTLKYTVLFVWFDINRMFLYIFTWILLLWSFHAEIKSSFHEQIKSPTLISLFYTLIFVLDQIYDHHCISQILSFHFTARSRHDISLA